MTLLRKGYRGMTVLFDLNSDLLLYAGIIAMALTGGAYLGQIVF
ncbi:hypothetical protein [Pseudooceanicola sp. 200-1SW]